MGEEHVFRHRQVFHQLVFLIDHAESRLQRLLGCFEVDLLAIQNDLALIRRVYAGQHLNEGGFSRAVLSYEAHNLSFIQLQMHLVQGPDPRKRCCYPFYL